LKLNKNEFPLSVSKLLRDYSKAGVEPEDIKINIWPVKTWYKATFQKGNRWNKALIRKRTMRYSVIELNQLVVAFRLLFNQEKKYNQTFINTVTNIIEERTAEEEGLIEPRIKISQKSYTELLHVLGDLKASGEIKNSYRELAAIIYHTFSPETKLRPSTILDRLKNQKGFK
jgi:hypothetical protein